MAESNRCQLNFIVGVSRGGTTWLTKVLNEHPKVASFGETGFWGRSYLKPRKHGCYDAEQMEQIYRRFSGMHITPVGNEPGDLPPEIRRKWPQLVRKALDRTTPPVPPGVVFRSICSSLADYTQCPVVVEKTPHHVNHIDRIHSQLPNARFLVMLRNPYDFMLSYKFQGQQLSAQTRSVFEKLYHPFVPALVWRRYWRSAEAAQRLLPDQVKVVTLKQLRQDPDRVLDEVIEFFGQPPERQLASRVKPSNSSFPDGERPELMPRDIAAMNVLAKKEIEAFGAEVRPVSHQYMRTAASAASIPIWAARNGAVLRRSVSGSFFRYVWKIVKSR